MKNLRQTNQAALKLDDLITQQANKLLNQGYQDLSGAAQNPALPDSNVFFTTSTLGMNSISHVIEDQALKMGQAIRFYSSFQKFSRVKPQEERYRKILASHIPIYLFGLPDMSLWADPYLHPIPLTMPSDPATPSLVHNWFVVLDNPQFVSMALVSRELPNTERPLHAPDKLLYRNFQGFWTYDKEVINQVVVILDEYIQGFQAASDVSHN